MSRVTVSTGHLAVMAADDRTWAPCWHCPALESAGGVMAALRSRPFRPLPGRLPGLPGGDQLRSVEDAVFAPIADFGDIARFVGEGPGRDMIVWRAMPCCLAAQR